MSRIERAKQFAPFDAVSGLHEVLRLKEYEHERKMVGDLSDEQVEEISNVLRQINKIDMVEVVYFEDGYEKRAVGKAKLNVDKHQITVNCINISLDNIRELHITQIKNP